MWNLEAACPLRWRKATLTSTETIVNQHTSKEVTAISDHFHYVFFGGDMVTAKRQCCNSKRWMLQPVFLLAVEAHILSAAMQVFGMSSLHSTSSNTELFLEKSVKLNTFQRQNVFLFAVKELVLNWFVNLSLHLMDFADSIREGGGERIICCWSVLSNS